MGKRKIGKIEKIVVRATFCTEDGEVLISEMIEATIDPTASTLANARGLLDSTQEAAAYAYDAMRILLARHGK